MPECTNCGSPVEESDNFCSNCGEPQNEQARNKLDRMIDKQAEKRASSGSTGMDDREELIARVSYALGFLFVVAGVSVLPNPGGVPVLLGGILLFPPVRLLSARAFGSPLKVEANAAIAAILALIGAAVYVLL
ncbi:zinc ribbon domain-containing protein [Halohasta salina]|uniref:zinc ribbon domain-containing protein n=1 Tax=Halohasta salina TaxID=2961621 RepID=UPI0020A31132|nr:zinc ribbon domain-containing protein [Halohasta salina]